MEVSGTLLAFCFIVLLHGFEIVWVYYQVNHRGPLRAQETVRRVLDDPVTWSNLKKNAGAQLAQNSRWDKVAEKKARALQTRAEIATWATGQYGSIAPMILKGAEAMGLLSDDALGNLNDWGPLIKPFAENFAKKQKAVVSATNPYMEQ